MNRTAMDWEAVYRTLSRITETKKGPGADEWGNSGVLVAYPSSEAEVREVLALAFEQELRVIPQGNGTKRGWGGRLDQADILLCLQRMKGVVDHAAADLVMTVKPGTTMEEIQACLAERGQFLPLDPPFPQRATIGGVISANASGPKRLRYGSARDHVIGLRVVLADGTAVHTGAKVVKNVAGYDMNKLYIGAMGTLGVITEIHLKLRPKPVCEILMVLESPDGLPAIAAFSRLIMDSAMEPVALEVINPALSRQLLGRDSFCLAVGFEDTEKAVTAQENWVRAHLGPLKLYLTLRNEGAAEWWSRFAKLPYGAVTLKSGSWPQDLPEIAAFAEAEAARLGLTVLSHGGMGVGLARYHLQADVDRKLLAFTERLQAFAESKEGYALVEHAPLGFRQKAAVWGREQAHFRLMAGIKNQLDPKRILNPGRFVGGI